MVIPVNTWEFSVRGSESPLNTAPRDSPLAHQHIVDVQHFKIIFVWIFLFSGLCPSHPVLWLCFWLLLLFSCSVMSGSFVAPWTTLSHQAPLSMGLSRKGYWSGLPCPSPGDLPDLWDWTHISSIGRRILLGTCHSSDFNLVFRSLQLQFCQVLNNVSISQFVQPLSYNKVRRNSPFRSP